MIINTKHGGFIKVDGRMTEVTKYKNKKNHYCVI